MVWDGGYGWRWRNFSIEEREKIIKNVESGKEN